MLDCAKIGLAVLGPVAAITAINLDRYGPKLSAATAVAFNPVQKVFEEIEKPEILSNFNVVAASIIHLGILGAVNYSAIQTQDPQIVTTAMTYNIISAAICCNETIPKIGYSVD